MTGTVLFETISTGNEQKIAIATLHQPQTLNGLSLEMCRMLMAQLQEWQANESIAVVVLRGAGDKAFCAGGDLHRLYAAMRQSPRGDPWTNVYARSFFEVEYRLDHLIHTFRKPILCWASGIVMGGGVGLMMGASHRVVTDSTRFAMPEISIGLFPDVGGSRMLGRLPGGLGRFLALSGAQLEWSDCRYLGLADYGLPCTSWPQLLDAMRAATWSNSDRGNGIQLHRILATLTAEPLPPGPLQKHWTMLSRLCQGPDFGPVYENIVQLQASDDPWLSRAGATLHAGSPGSARLSFALLDRSNHLSLADVFRQEYTVALQCCARGDLQEGIRALLIDKDRKPNWSPATVAQATEDWAEGFFSASVA